MSERRRKAVYTIPPATPFLPALVDGLISGDLIADHDLSADPLALAGVTLYLPTRRAARVLPGLFQARLGTRASLLPVIRPLGDVDEDEHLLNAAAPVDGLPPALPDMQRRMAMTRLVHLWEGALRREVLELAADAPLHAPASAADAAWLAGDLIALMDEIETEEVGWAGLADLVPEDHARYWQITLDFLKIAMAQWPAYLAEVGAVDPKARRSALIRREAARLRANPPEGPVIVAGATGSVPATADLLAAVADLPQGCIVLPGFDGSLDQRSWQALIGVGEGHGEGQGAPSHPQYGMARLVRHLGLGRGEVRELAAAADPARRLRDRLVGEALRPAETTDAWPRTMAGVPVPDRLAAFAGVDLLTARNEAEEALAVALVLRRAVAEGQSAALISPDRTLGRRVAVELTRWGLQVDDSAGRPLDQTPPGVLARLAAGLALGGLEPVALLALLKHPLVRLGLPAREIRAAARALERGLLRGPRPRAGSAGLLAAITVARALAEEPGATRRMPRWKKLHPADWDAMEDLARRLAEALEPLERLVTAEGEGEEACDAADLVAAHEAVLVALVRDETGASDELYAGEAGEGLAATFADMLAARSVGLEVAARDWPDVFAALISGINVRRRLPGDPRIAIFGPMEARLQHFDVVVLGALNEGTWPQRTRNDPWLNRPMKQGIGLDPPERRIGAAAHDFVQGLGAAKVVLSRSERSGGAPAVASRWLLRLVTLLGKETAEAMRARGRAILAIAARMDQTDGPPRPAPRPEPAPPVAARPDRLSVTAVETLIRDPYAIYAQKVLGLDPVEPIGGDPGAAEKGTLIHDCLAVFLESWTGDFGPAALERLLEIGRERFAPLDAFPAVRALWWLRFERIAEAFIGYEATRAPDVDRRFLEVDGRLELDLVPGRKVALTARADRLDLGRDGTLTIIDYKTGQAPSAKEVAALLAPQLPLEAALVAAGGFADVDPGALVTDLLYLRLSGGRTALEVLPRAPKDREVADLAEEALQRTKALFAGYENPAKGYLSRARVMKERARGGPYDHLARVPEWSLGGDEDT
ncbi:double-strand break repair protein AddB [Stappia taiwanensis]|uniref:Double-strand break repair protein AddB n=1 Tax=Stappia taiwanensis TaxID=992267 RepID=A0A838XUP7_9HYPH|nr:double-strand break repair protein AddB [Stappia taiwanensis]MBA4613447.1 double-strand break repair protein AddB [Stappia taiwanensis]GGF02404.1 double-strand break repair protein AddB [Stappia taiwanensis]